MGEGPPGLALTRLNACFHPKLAKVKKAVELPDAGHAFGKVFQEAISNLEIEHIHSKVSYRDLQYGFTEYRVPAA